MATTHLIGQQAHHGRVFHPRQLLQSCTALAQGDEEDVAAQVGSEDGEELGPRHLGVAHELDGGGGGNAETGILSKEVTDEDGQPNQSSQGNDRSHCGRDAPRRVVGTRPRRTGTRRRARRNPSSPESAPFFGTPSFDLARAVDEGAGR